ncbi:MAG: D-alanyl-D-alanine carboxypeptidase/D-alanyl-D-alanine-endopeptidase [Desulfobulbaceae bacterium]|nr:D-alanyl-D-alanine carboxypeptidase/D-alanyl-D-alanine-endopeptidase [Desulfobulbaceae bacterium]
MKSHNPSLPFCYFLFSLIVLMQLSACTNNRGLILSSRSLPDGVMPVIGLKNLQTEIDSIINDPSLNSSTISIKIIRVSDNETVYEQNPDKVFHPASTMKLFTTAAVLNYLRPDYRFRTSIAVQEGSWQNEKIDGDIYLIGRGDPSLTSSDLASLAARLHSLGIRTITGNIVCDDSFLDDIRYGSGWMWDDQPYKDFAPIGALSVNRNTAEIYVSPGSSRGEAPQVRILPDSEFISKNNTATTTAGDESTTSPLSVLRQWRKHNNIIDISGTIARDSQEVLFTRNIVNPALYTGNLFKDECLRYGITINGTVVRDQEIPSSIIIAEHQSDRITSLIADMNKESHNLYAELLLKTIGAEVMGGQGTAEKGLAVIRDLMSKWGITEDSFKFSDGSGVSRYNLVSANTLAMLLEKMHTDFTTRHEFIASLAIAGIDGSLKDRMTTPPSKGLVHAKTGYLSGVSVLAGYTRSYDGQTLAFVIMMEHFIGSADPYFRAQDRICNILCRYANQEN